MIIESLDEYLETVAGYIYDDDKLVTYKWLSKELEVHVNIAKQILWEFGRKHQQERTIERTFLLMGTLSDGGMRVEVVREADLSVAKKKFDKIISEHVYSLQKALPDIQLLAISGDGDVKYSAIKCKDCTERTDEEMHKLRWGSDLSCNIPISRKPVEETKHATEPEQEKRAKTPEKTHVDVKKGGQRKGFNNLFGNTANKQKTSPSTSSNNSKKVTSENSHDTKRTSPKKNTSTSPKKKIQKTGLDSFIEQGRNQEKIKKSVSPEEKKNRSSPLKEKLEKTTVSENNNKPKKAARGKKRNHSKETNTAAKRRKRVTVETDSSDEGSSNEEEGNDEPEPPPSPEYVPPVKARSPSPPKVKHEGGKRKILKMVDKTFEEDGYLVTKKVHVYESCSEEEPELEPKKRTPESRPEPKGKKNNKQTTLTNFFKKS